MSAVVAQKTSDSFKKGDTIFREGEIGEEMYIIKTGSVEVVKKIRDEEVVLAQLKAGSFFGEMALFGDKHRNATIKALTDCEMIVINKHILDKQLSMAPDWFVAIMKTLVHRLKETNKRIKSRYTISLEYTLLKLILWGANKYGERETGGLKVELAAVKRDIQAIMGVSPEELHDKMRDFTFVKMIKYAPDENEILIPDEDKLKNFLFFLQAKNDKKTRMTSAF